MTTTALILTYDIVESGIKHHNPTHMYGSTYGIGATIIFNESV
jgi:hypothetical protein